MRDEHNIQEVLSDIGEILITTLGQDWSDIKDNVAHVTYAQLLEWKNALQSAFGDELEEWRRASRSD